ncbi:MAG: Ig-like domain-containing protein [Bacilli bacterium]|jgi:uncharacterized protein YjdB
MNVKKFTLFFVIFLLGLFLVGCDLIGDDGGEDEPLDDTPTEVMMIYEGGDSLIVGETKQLSATVAPAIANQAVTWSSSDESVATISAAGLLTAVGEGTVSITVTSSELTTIVETIEFTIIETDAQKMAKLNGAEATIRNLLPEVLTEDLVLPDADGVVLVRYIYDGTFHPVGTVFKYKPAPTDLKQTFSVNVSYGGKSKTFDVSIVIAKDVSLAGITGSSYVFISESTTLLSSLTGTGLTWSSSDVTVATVDQEGKVTGVNEGEAVITITDGEVSYTFTIAVIAAGKPDLLKAYQAKNHILSNIPASTRENFDLPTFTGAAIEYQVDSEVVTEFVAEQGINNVVVTIDTTVTVNETVINFEVKVVVIAKTDDVIVAEALAALDAYLEEKGYLDEDFKAAANLDFAGFTFEGVTVTWVSGLANAISNAGVYKRGNDDVLVPLEVSLRRASQSQIRKFSVLAAGYTQAEKIDYIVNDPAGDLKFLDGYTTKGGITLPIKDSKFGTTITWASSNTDIISNTGALVAPVETATEITLTATIVYYKQADYPYNFTQDVAFPITINPFEHDVDKASYYYGLSSTCIPEHFPYGKTAVNQLTNLDATFVHEEYTYNITWAPADTTIFDAEFNLLKQYFMYKSTSIVATLTREGSENTATVNFTVNVGIAEKPSDVAITITSDVSLAGFNYEKWLATNGFKTPAADGGKNIGDRSWQGFSGNIFKTTITANDVEYVIYVVSAKTNYANLTSANVRAGSEAIGESADKMYLASTGLSGSFGRVVKNTTDASIWVVDTPKDLSTTPTKDYFSGFNYMAAYKAIILNFDSESKLCTPIEVPMNGDGTEYEIKPGGFMLQRGYICQGVYDILRNETLTVEHLFFTSKYA